MTTSLTFLANSHFYYRDPAPEPPAQAPPILVPMIRPERTDVDAPGEAFTLSPALRGRVARVATLDGRDVAFERWPGGIGLTSGSRSGLACCRDEQHTLLAYLQRGTGAASNSRLRVGGFDGAGRNAAFPGELWSREGCLVRQDGGQVGITKDGAALLGRVFLERGFEPGANCWVECGAEWLGLGEGQSSQLWLQRRALPAAGARELALRVDLRVLPLGRATAKLVLVERDERGLTQPIEEVSVTVLHRPVMPIEHLERQLRSALDEVPGVEPGRAMRLARITNDRPEVLTLRMVYTSLELGVCGEKSAKEIQVPAGATRDLVVVQPVGDRKSRAKEPRQRKGSGKAAIRIGTVSSGARYVPLVFGGTPGGGASPGLLRAGCWTFRGPRGAVLVVQPFVGLHDAYVCEPVNGAPAPLSTEGNQFQFGERAIASGAEWIVRETQTGWSLSLRVAGEDEDVGRDSDDGLERVDDRDLDEELEPAADAGVSE